MSIFASVIADSVSEDTGIRLTTLQLRYPRFIHAEFMTHRVFSRNASSSRAIPINKIIKETVDDLAIPIHWGKNQKGMQADEELDETSQLHAEGVWKIAAAGARQAARQMVELGVHKQIANRVLEPFTHINVLVTATEWDNFFELRDHKDAQPEIHALARQMKDVMAESVPTPLYHWQWHLPYIELTDMVRASEATGKPSGDPEMIELLCQVSAARCARISYFTHEGTKPEFDADLRLFNRLVGSAPLHASPLEHIACPDRLIMRSSRMEWDKVSQHRNLSGWRQYRAIYEESFYNDD